MSVPLSIIPHFLMVSVWGKWKEKKYFTQIAPCRRLFSRHVSLLEELIKNRGVTDGTVDTETQGDDAFATSKEIPAVWSQTWSQNESPRWNRKSLW